MDEGARTLVAEGEAHIGHALSEREQFERSQQTRLRAACSERKTGFSVERPTNNSIDATSQMWAFFVEHPLSRAAAHGAGHE